MKTTFFYIKGLTQKQYNLYYFSLLTYLTIFIIVRLFKSDYANIWQFILVLVGGALLFSNILSFIFIRKVIINDLIIDSGIKYLVFIVSIILTILVLFININF